MKILRTPEESFANLEGYPFKPHYTTINTNDGDEIRIHHLDEGPRDGSIVFCLHGQPAWSYLFRKMIPILTSAGMRVIAPDLPGYGKSDKPGAREDYSYQNQVDWMSAWLTTNDFTDITFFGQDWGGLIGLRLVAAHPDRFSRVVISNTGLPLPGKVLDEHIKEVEAFWAAPETPNLAEMSKAVRRMGGGNSALKFAHWQKFCWETKDLPIGLIMYLGTHRASAISMALNIMLSKIGLGKIARSPLAKAYGAPFPTSAHKMGPRAMPSNVPILPDDPSIAAQRQAWDALSAFEKPFLCAFTDKDPITRGGDAPFLKKVPGAAGQPHKTIKGGGHFVQEDKPEELSQTIIDFVRAGR